MLSFRKQKEVMGIFYRTQKDFLKTLRIELKHLDSLPEHFLKGDSRYSTISFSSPSKMSDFIALKVGSAITIHKDGREVFFKECPHIIEAASARNCFYYYDTKSGIKKVSIDSEGLNNEITDFYPICKGRNSMRTFMNTSAIFLAESSSSAVALMLNLKGDKTHTLNLINHDSRSHYIVDLAVCDDPCPAPISTLLALSRNGLLLCFKISKNSKILVKTEHSLSTPLPGKPRYKCYVYQPARKRGMLQCWLIRSPCL